MLSVIYDHRDKTPHYPWEFALSDLSITNEGGRIVVATPNSKETGFHYVFKHDCTLNQFKAWFAMNYNAKFHFMHNFKEETV